MPTFSTDIQDKITLLRGLYRLGESPRTVEFIQVDWPTPTGTIYYTWQGQVDETIDVACPVSPVVCTLKPSSTPDGFLDIQQTSSVGDESVDIEFWDPDGTVAQYLVDHGEGIKTTRLLWFPDQDLLLPDFEAHLQLEDEVTVDILKLKAANGFRDAEGTLPGGGHYQHCWSLFAGRLATQAEIDLTPCNFNLHIGGLIGTNDPATGLPWTFCDRLTTQSCIDRGVDPLRHYSHRTITATVFNGQTHGGNLFSTSQGNENNLPDPPRVVFAPRRIYGMAVIAFRRDINNNHPDQGFFFAGYEGPHGPQASVSGARITLGGTEQTAIPMHFNYRLGTFGQPAWPGLSDHGYSGFSYIVYNWGPVNPWNISPSNASATAIWGGMTDVRTYNDPDDLTSFTTGVTSNRAWQIARMLCDKIWGYGYDYSRLAIDTFIETAAWCAENVRFTDTFGNVWDHVRADSYPELIGKKTQEQFEDICRAGFLSRPFLFNGKIHVIPLRALTTDEFAAAPVFNDTPGEDCNICRDENGKSTLTIGPRISDKDLVNQIKVTFDDRANDWIETPLRPVEDEDAQLAAGRVMGDKTRKINSKDYALPGVTFEPQAVKAANRLLDCGPFDEGGLKNNLPLKFTTWYIETLDLHQEKVIRVISSRITKYKEPGTETSFEYFRVKKIERKSDLKVELTVQAYAKTYMDNFETTVPTGGGSCSVDADCPDGFVCVDGVCVSIIGGGGFCSLTSDCPDGYECINGVCVPKIIIGGCRPGIDNVEYRDGVIIIDPGDC